MVESFEQFDSDTLSGVKNGVGTSKISKSDDVVSPLAQIKSTQEIGDILGNALKLCDVPHVGATQTINNEDWFDGRDVINEQTDAIT